GRNPRATRAAVTRFDVGLELVPELVACARGAAGMAVASGARGRRLHTGWLAGGARAPVSERRPSRGLRGAYGAGAAGRRLLGQPAANGAAAAGAGGRTIARLIRNELHRLVTHGPGRGDPVQDFRRRGLKLPTRQ